jgi:hypothetical protein
VKRGLALLLIVLSGCGAGAPRRSAEVRARLGSPEGSVARERAPDLIAEVEAALRDADAAERAGDSDAAADHVTRARLMLDAAQAEAARIADEQERRRVEAQVAEVVARARRDEEAREVLSAELTRNAALRAAREEAERALAQAAQDEARPGRRVRVSLEEAQDLRRAAAALRARARLTAAAAEALGAPAEALRAVTEAVEASEGERTDPRGALASADRAYREALRALGAARRGAEAPTPDARSALAEAARLAGLEVVSLPDGLAVEAEGVFAGTRPRPAHVERLAALVAAHPHGPVQIQAQASTGGRRGEQLAAQRAEALRRALVEAGADADRLRTGALPAALAGDGPVDRVRVVFVAYVP